MSDAVGVKKIFGLLWKLFFKTVSSSDWFLFISRFPLPSISTGRLTKSMSTTTNGEGKINLDSASGWDKVLTEINIFSWRWDCPLSVEGKVSKALKKNWFFHANILIEDKVLSLWLRLTQMYGEKQILISHDWKASLNKRWGKAFPCPWRYLGFWRHTGWVFCWRESPSHHRFNETHNNHWNQKIRIKVEQRCLGFFWRGVVKFYIQADSQVVSRSWYNTC